MKNQNGSWQVGGFSKIFKRNRAPTLVDLGLLCGLVHANPNAFLARMATGPIPWGYPVSHYGRGQSVWPQFSVNSNGPASRNLDELENLLTYLGSKRPDLYFFRLKPSLSKAPSRNLKKVPVHGHSRSFRNPYYLISPGSGGTSSF